MNIPKASLTDLIKMFEASFCPDYTFDELLIINAAELKSLMKLRIAYETFLAKRHSEKALDMMEQYQDLYDYEPNVGI